MTGNQHIKRTTQLQIIANNNKIIFGPPSESLLPAADIWLNRKQMTDLSVSDHKVEVTNQTVNGMSSFFLQLL